MTRTALVFLSGLLLGCSCFHWLVLEPERHARARQTAQAIQIIFSAAAYLLTLAAAYLLHKRAHMWQDCKHSWSVGDRTVTLFWCALCPPIALLLALILVLRYWHYMTQHHKAKW